MPKITFLPSNRTVEVPQGSELLDAARKAGLTVEVPCGGKGVCGRCLVQVTAGRAAFADNGVLPRDLLDEGYVLICRAKVDGDATVRTGAELSQEQGSFTNIAEDRALVDAALLPADADLQPLVQSAALRVPPGELGDGLSDYDRLSRAALDALGGKELRVPLSALRRLPVELRQRDGAVELLYWRDGEAICAVDVRAQAGKWYGIAVDIGTTTVAVQLVDLSTGTILRARTDYNAQISCGLDIISRINYARRPERLQELREKVLGSINGLVAALSQEQGIAPQDIMAASMAGNTTMTHLLLGIVPEYIRLEPYVSAVFTPPLYRAGEVGIHIHTEAPVRLAPAVGSYVGGDITSGLLCTSLSTDSEEICLFIDIGTNGEIVLGNGDFLLGCACSAGPAFEGGGIDCGMRASQGAIEWVDVDAATGLPQVSVIGGGSPLGICGSGMISLLASLFETGWMDAAGKLDRSRTCAAILPGKVARYELCDAGHSGTGNALYISETDIDNVIRAKGAIFSACQVLLGKVSLEFSDLSRILIAGGFGRYLDVRRSVTIGLLPDVEADKLHFIGNSSVLGAYCTLVSEKHRQREAAAASRITYLDLSAEPEYMDAYTGALFLPHTDERLFPSVGRR